MNLKAGFGKGEGACARPRNSASLLSIEFDLTPLSTSSTMLFLHALTSLTLLAVISGKLSGGINLFVGGVLGLDTFSVPLLSEGFRELASVLVKTLEECTR